MTDHTPTCAVCREPLTFGRNSEIERIPTYPTEREAHTAAIDNEWTDLGGGRLACRISDPAHDDARDAAALSREGAVPPPTRHVHATITNPDEFTANRAALSLADWIRAEFPGHVVATDAQEWPASTSEPPVPAPQAPADTLPAWLRQRFTASSVDWDQLDDAERSYWEHQARAVRRAVERGGFKTTPATDQTERRDRYAEALYATLEVSSDRHPWATLGPLRRKVWYDRADAAMAVADAEQAELASLAVNAGRALQDEKRHYEIACEENARLRARVAELGPPAAVPAVDRAALRDRIAEALISWTYRGKDSEHGGILETVRANAYGRADAVLAVLPDTSRAAFPSVRPHTLVSIACHLDARAVAIMRPDSQTFAEWQTVIAELRRMADETPATEARCTCADAGACFAPADHYADCPAAGARQDGAPS